MIGLGTLINTAAIVAGGVAGRFVGKLLKERHRETLNMACGISTLFIGISGAIEGLNDGGSLSAVISLALGGLIGEIIDIERLFERLGEYLKAKTGNSGDSGFVNAFITASLTVCIGAMAIVGSIQDGISGDYSILATKSVLDLIIVAVMTCSLGKGCAFSAVPVLLLEGLMTLAAMALKPLMTQPVLDSISMIGSMLIFCVGVNLVWGKKVRVANLLPALVVGAVWAAL